MDCGPLALLLQHDCVHHVVAAARLHSIALWLLTITLRRCATAFITLLMHDLVHHAVTTAIHRTAFAANVAGGRTLLTAASVDTEAQIGVLPDGHQLAAHGRRPPPVNKVVRGIGGTLTKPVAEVTLSFTFGNITTRVDALVLPATAVEPDPIVPMASIHELDARWHKDALNGAPLITVGGVTHYLASDNTYRPSVMRLDPLARQAEQDSSVDIGATPHGLDVGSRPTARPRSSNYCRPAANNEVGGGPAPERIPPPELVWS